MLITLTGNHTNDKTQQKLLQQQLGVMNSTMEHLIPEQLFSTEESPAHGVSAVKAIQLAAAEGQRIYHITSANLETALASIDLNTSVEREIREAVYAGKEVTTHSHRINFYGKVTAGYIIVDPLTGNGVYKIASGEDGAILLGLIAGFGFMAFLGGVLAGGGLLVTVLGILLAAHVFGSLVAIATKGDVQDLKCFATGFSYGMLLFGIAISALWKLKLPLGLTEKQLFIHGLVSALISVFLGEVVQVPRMWDCSRFGV